MPRTLVLMMLILISIIFACKEEPEVIEHWKGYEMVTVVQEPCLEFVSPILLDNAFFGEQGVKELDLSRNASMLAAYLKNSCADTVLVGLNLDYITQRLNVGFVREKWDKDYMSGGAGTVYCFGPIHYYCPIPSGDSLFVTIQQISHEVACMMDSVIVYFHSKVGNKKVQPTEAKIDGLLLRG